MKKNWKYELGWIIGFVFEGLVFGLVFFITCEFIAWLIDLALKFIM